LRRRGYRILCRNFKCPAGEVDAIAFRDHLVVFVEIKTRRSEDAADVSESVHPSQWRRVERAARYFLSRHPEWYSGYRFDLVTVLWPKKGVPQVEHRESAHQPRWI